MAMKPITCIRCRQPAMRSHTSHSGFCLPCSNEHDKESMVACVAARRAVAAGQILPIKGQLCVDCGAPARDYEHRDYLAPLEVQPVCRSCNQRRGPAFDSKYRPAVAA